MKKKFNAIGAEVADRFSKFVGSWTFVFLYTSCMFTWIVLHVSGVLHIDSPDFIKWNLLLSYFAGTQASIILMSTERQADKDSARLERMLRKIVVLEEVIEDYIDENSEGKEDEKEAS